CLVSLIGQSQGILFIRVVGACTDYALLLVARYREELTTREQIPGAVLAAIRGVIGPVLASGGTVILGLLCLLAADLASTRSLGPVVAIGVAAAMLSAMTFLPAALALCGRAAFWPTAPHHQRHEEDQDIDQVLARHPLWGRITAVVADRPRAFWVGTTVVLLVAAVFAPSSVPRAPVRRRTSAPRSRPWTDRRPSTGALAPTPAPPPPWWWPRNPTWTRSWRPPRASPRWSGPPRWARKVPRAPTPPPWSRTVVS